MGIFKKRLAAQCVFLKEGEERYSMNVMFLLPDSVWVSAAVRASYWEGWGDEDFWNPGELPLLLSLCKVDLKMTTSRDTVIYDGLHS